MKILTPLQEKILKIFTRVPDSEYFYLTGGTALSAFYLKHRKSHDLDFFTSEEEIILSFSNALEEILKKEGIKTRRLRGLHSFVEILIEKNKEITLIHLAKDSPFRLRKVVDIIEYNRLKVDSLTDIAANKLLTVFSRAALRDFIDIYFLVNERKFLKGKLIAYASKKDPGFDLYWFATAIERINYFKKDAAEMHLLLKSCELGDLISFFNSWREEISKKLKL